jgi:Brp/Blh family beta-carotene 15,15'-monooxygenase
VKTPKQSMTLFGAYGLLAGVQRTPANAFSSAQCLQVAVTVLLLLSSAMGIDLGTAAITGGCCILILLLGLPHGAIDIISLLDVKRTRRRQARAIGLYLMAGSAMALIWWQAPGFALALFFGIAIVHFSEDWLGIQSPFLAHGTALGLLIAPSILHSAQIGVLFQTLSGANASAFVGSVMTLAIPVALGCVIVAASILWENGRREAAVTGLVALSGLALLPPLVGFTLFFCLHHSPRHFSAALGPDARSALRTWKTPISCATAAALGFTVLLFALLRSPSISDGLIRASFMTLSVLTVPHMMLPRILAKR